MYPTAYLMGIPSVEDKESPNNLYADESKANSDLLLIPSAVSAAPASVPKNDLLFIPKL